MPASNLRSAIAQLTRGGRSVRSRDNVSDSNGSVGTVVAVGRVVGDFVSAILVGSSAFLSWELIQVLEYGRTALRDIEEHPDGKALAAELRDPRNWFFRR